MGDLPNGIGNSPIVGYLAVAALRQLEFHIITEGATGRSTAVLHCFPLPKANVLPSTYYAFLLSLFMRGLRLDTSYSHVVINTLGTWLSMFIASYSDC